MASLGTTVKAVRASRLGERVSVFDWVARLLAAGFALLVLYPISRFLIDAFVGDDGPTLAPIRAVLDQPSLDKLLANTFGSIGIAAVAAVLVGSTFAWVNERTDAHLGWVGRTLPLVPLLVPPVAGAIGWSFLLSSRAGILNIWLREVGSWFGLHSTEGPIDFYSFGGLTFLYFLYFVPWVYLVMTPALRNLDPALEEAARVSAAGPVRTLFTVALPAVKSSLAGSLLLVVSVGLAMISVPAIVGTPAGIEVIPTRILRISRYTYPPDIDGATGLGLLVFAVVLVGWVVYTRIGRSGLYGTIGGKGRTTARVELGRWRNPARFAILGYLAATTILPFAALVIVSLQRFWTPTISPSAFTLDGYRRVLLEDEELSLTSIRVSMTLGLVGATVAMVLASAVALSFRRAPGRTAALLAGVLKIPSALSAIVIGLAFIVAFGGTPFRLNGTTLILLLAYLVAFAPQAAVSAETAFDQVGKELSEASTVSGAGGWRTTSRIVVPLMVPGIAAGWALVFVLMASELQASALLAGVNNPVVSFTILAFWENGNFSVLAALAVMLTLVTSVVVLGVVAVAERLRRT